MGYKRLRWASNKMRDCLWSLLANRFGFIPIGMLVFVLVGLYCTVWPFMCAWEMVKGITWKGKPTGDGTCFENRRV